MLWGRTRGHRLALGAGGAAFVAIAVTVTVPTTTTGCTTHQCDTSQATYSGGIWTDAYTYETSDLDGDWIPFPGQVTLNVVFPPRGASPQRAVTSIESYVGTGVSPNGGADFQGGELNVPGAGQLTEFFFISSSGFFVANASCAKYFARFVVHFAREGFTLFGGVGPGGDGGVGTLNDTWTWDGAVWFEAGSVTDAGPEIGPTARQGSAMVSVGGATYLIGGFDGVSSYLPDTWSWNGAVWTQTFLTPENPPAPPWPSARADAATAVVNGGQQLVLFGGHGVDVTNNGAIGDLQDTWTWDGKTSDSWISVAPGAGAGPSARSGAAAAALGSTMLLFGGSSNGTPLGDTWTWNGSTWMQLPVTGPAPRFHAAAATVPGGVLLFGGDSGSGALGDTWLWDAKGGTWAQQKNAAPAPSPRSQASVGVMNGVVVLFGGTDGTLQFSDTWTWSGTSTEGGWVLMDPAAPPTPRYGAAAAGP